MSLKSLVSGALILVGLMGLALVVAPTAEASHLSDPTRCTCSASLSFSRPSLQWKNGVLNFIPRVDISIRGRGEAGAPPLTVSIGYSGVATYETEDEGVAVPADTAFAGNQPVVVGWPCEGRYKFKGLELTPVELTGVTQGGVGEDEELSGAVALNAAVVGCGFEEEQRQLRFRVQEFGNLKIGFWRSV
jgi:hypothetical protein